MSESFEARQWLHSNPNKNALAAGRFVSSGEAVAYVNRLYLYGAVNVSVVEVVNESWRGGPYSDTLLVELPSDERGRQNIFGLYNRELQVYGEDFSGGKLEYTNLTAEQAQAIGQPELEGELMIIEQPLADTGQTTLTFKWE